MNWIPIQERLPDDRRKVFVVVRANVLGLKVHRMYATVSKFNPSPKGGKWDEEQGGGLIARQVTHWAEIKLPTVYQEQT